MSPWSLSVSTVSVLLAALALPPGAPPRAVAADDGTGSVISPAELVNVFHGTKEAALDFGHGGGGGMTFPGAVLPFGMMQWSPDTVESAGGGYRYEDNRLRGYSMTHISGPGCNGAQDFPVMPFSGKIGRSPATHGMDYVQTFKHENEKAAPGFYSSTLDTGISTELSVSARAGVARFSFPAGRPATLLLNTSGSINGVDDGETRIGPNSVEGWIKTGGFCGPPLRYKVYFHATFDQPFTGYGTWKNDEVRPGTQTTDDASKARARADLVTGEDVTVNGPGSGAYLEFDPARPVQMRVGLSYVSIDGARANLGKEIGDKALDQVRQEATAVWDRRLGQVRIAGGTEDQRRTFYSNLYHALLQPYVFEDVDGTYTGFDGKPRTVRPGHHQYATFSGWDIYRSEAQLLALLVPDVAADIAQSMYDNAQAIGNVWDRWSHQTAVTGVMVGDPYHSILSTMYAFGARDFDAGPALKAMAEAARRVGAKDIGHPEAQYDERPGNADYMAKGYVPSDPSSTLEYAVADFGIAQLAGRLGDQTTATEFMKRAQSWQNLYNPGNGWIQPRMGEGSFTAPFDPAAPDVYMEGNGAQYHWMVPHNPQGLFAAMGGLGKVVPRLDEYFKKLNAGPREAYAYLGNEIALQSPWLYAWAGQPYKTQNVVRRVQQELFKSGPDGLVGNDDLGTMGAWYVWSAMGLFPAIPGRAELLVSTPLFDKVTVSRPAGDIVVSAPNAAANRYIQTLRVNGVATSRAWLPESFATQGGRLDFGLGAWPNPAFGADPRNAPPSFGQGSKPYLTALTPGAAPVEPGGAVDAELSVQSLGAAATVTWQAKPPTGITVTPASGTLSVPAGGRAAVKVRISVAAGAGLNLVTVPISVADPAGSSVGDLTASTRLNVARRGTIAWYHNNAGIGDVSTPDEANIDGPGFSYPAHSLADAGLKPGATLAWKGFTFTWPDRKPGQVDNLRPGTQPIEMTAPAGATKLAFLGAGVNGWPESEVTITYTDGSTGTGKLGFSEWILDFGGAQPAFGNEVVASAPFRLFWGSWALQPIGTHVFAAQPIALDPAKTVRSVTFSTPEDGELHLFAWAFA
ncbi:GH92 family glycosyl hydrolase [Nonomuraea roseoviolacea]|uniref:Alpha-1,2-mannosidase n=1 Tax=Nonomuraea roseoviolacea subsp. carminata TaxID=160689 RepID=A0ABT1K5J5_9ACTN|nr:GH92 family glycosyl hydrolase [Nonomuraea roseoviolacea]MCP2348942.1 putative alpha-1,2-mannosidase [Nonomuraea roseoviolacea subsp. carminata]